MFLIQLPLVVLLQFGVAFLVGIYSFVWRYVGMAEVISTTVLSGFGMGHRSRRFAAIVNDGKIELLNVEPGGEVGVSSAETVLGAL